MTSKPAGNDKITLLETCQSGSHTNVNLTGAGTDVVGFRKDPYYLRGQPTCCRSTGRSPN